MAVIKKQLKPKTILEQIMEENPGCIDTYFSMEAATLIKDVRRLKFKVSNTLEKTNRYYKIFLYFDQKPFLESIDRNLKHIAEIKSNATLFDATKGGDKEKKAKIEEVTEKNDKLKEEHERLKLECPDFDFNGENEKTEYNKDTFFVKVDKGTLSFINDKSALLHHYRMMLKPNI